MLASLAIGFLAVVALWIVWLLTHMPATSAWFPPAITGPLLLVVLIAALTLALRQVPRADRPLVGAFAGLVAGLGNLLILGSKLTEPTDAARDLATKAQAAAAGEPIATVIPAAPLLAAGWVLLCVVLGLVAGLLARALAPREPAPADRPTWLARLTWVNALAVLPLIALGGATTTAKAGFAVPDWPGTYGANMFLYPISLMSEPRIFLEHSHRLFGAMAGLITLSLFGATLAFAPRPWHKLFALGLLVAIIVQGVLGGLWVNDKTLWKVLAHGTLAQLFIGALAAYATMLGQPWRAWRESGTAPAPRRRTVVVIALLLMMLVLGTMVRHMNHPHALYTHIGLSIFVVVFISIVGGQFARHKADPAHGRALRRIGVGANALVGLQFLLGWVALLAFLNDPTRKIAAPEAPDLAQAPAINATRLVARTIHQTNGALLMSSAAVMCAWGLARKTRPAP